MTSNAGATTGWSTTPSTSSTSTALTPARRHSSPASACWDPSLPRRPCRASCTASISWTAPASTRAPELELEGVVSKRAEAPYRSGRSEDWVKVKCPRRGRFVVVGYVPGAGGIAALRLGRRDGDQLAMWARSDRLHARAAAAVRRQLEAVAVKRSPLTSPIRSPARRGWRPNSKRSHLWPPHQRRAGPARIVQAAGAGRLNGRSR